jgi:hypothetical protein
MTDNYSPSYMTTHIKADGDDPDLMEPYQWICPESGGSPLSQEKKFRFRLAKSTLGRLAIEIGRRVTSRARPLPGVDF